MRLLPWAHVLAATLQRRLRKAGRKPQRPQLRLSGHGLGCTSGLRRPKLTRGRQLRPLRSESPLWKRASRSCLYTEELFVQALPWYDCHDDIGVE